VLSRRIDVRCDANNLFVAVLPHEVTHAVLAGRFGEQQVPIWAGEAMAVLSESREVIDRHLRNLPLCRDEEQLFLIAQLVELKDYPHPRYLRPYYAQSVSLVELLISEKGPPTFTRFLRDGLRHGYETALQRHYGWNFDQLERRWRLYAFGDDTSLSLSGEKARGERRR
jgi:hypothetical protein